MPVKKKKAQCQAWVGDYQGTLALFIQCPNNPDTAHILSAVQVYQMLNIAIKGRGKPEYVRQKRKA